MASFHIGEAIEQEGVNYVIEIIAGLISLGTHLGAIEWAEDLEEKRSVYLQIIWQRPVGNPFTDGKV